MTENAADPIQEVLDSLAADTERTRQQVEETRRQAQKTAQDLFDYQFHQLLGTEAGAERVRRTAEEHGVSQEAAARFLAPRAPAVTVDPGDALDRLLTSQNDRKA
ncbi:MAG: hypothetical protein LC751_13910 [Actinobacteria bacterium]|nr:hypothetical protein [Actinomycetota bacterium]MCA1738537.1 hypothetical protein [Actinomycetota bacterium]